MTPLGMTMLGMNSVDLGTTMLGTMLHMMTLGRTLGMMTRWASAPVPVLLEGTPEGEEHAWEEWGLGVTALLPCQPCCCPARDHSKPLFSTSDIKITAFTGHCCHHWPRVCRSALILASSGPSMRPDVRKALHPLLEKYPEVSYLQIPLQPVGDPCLWPRAPHLCRPPFPGEGAAPPGSRELVCGTRLPAMLGRCCVLCLSLESGLCFRFPQGLLFKCSSWPRRAA